MPTLSPVQIEKLKNLSTLEYILLGDLRDVLEEPFSKETRKWMLALLDALLDTIPREFRIRESGGYLEEVIEEFPSWTPQVEKLRSEHDTLEETLQSLRDRLIDDEVFQRQLLVQQIREELKEWMHFLIAHNRHEARILQTAMNMEIGGAD